MSNTHTDELLVDIETTMNRLGGLARSTVYELLATGEIEAVKLGRRRMVVAASLNAYVDRLRAEVTA